MVDTYIDGRRRQRIAEAEDGTSRQASEEARDKAWSAGAGRRVEADIQTAGDW